MPDSNKRKERQGDERGDDNAGVKRSKGGSGGKWQTPHQTAKIASQRGEKLEAGDQGIWATCARNQERRATVELKSMLEECAERFYGIVAGAKGSEEENSDEGDIESSIKKEVESMGNKKGTAELFSPVHLELQCVLFFKTRAPIDPVEFVHRICEEVLLLNVSVRRMRYVNRLTPMTLMGKATEKGLEEVGRAVLREHFQLAGEERKGDDGGLGQERGGCSYAIRPTIRNHKTLSRDAVIKLVASLVGDQHKVDLTKPDKVIVVEMYQTVCGISVVGSDWETLKRFNLAELYRPATLKAEAKPQAVATDDARLPAAGA